MHAMQHSRCIPSAYLVTTMAHLHPGKLVFLVTFAKMMPQWHRHLLQTADHHTHTNGILLLARSALPACGRKLQRACGRNLQRAFGRNLQRACGRKLQRAR
jgi:hypothetical protein